MKLLGAVAAVTAVFVMAGTAYADEVNLFMSYEKAEWQGDSLAYDSRSGAIFFANDGTEKTATLEITAQGTGIYFSIDAGNGVNTSDSGYCTLEFCGEDEEVLYSVSTGGISGLENFSRFYLGSEESYYPLPEGTRKLVLSLHAAPTGESGNVNIYFRNLSLYMSDKKPLAADEKNVYMKSIAGLTKVEVGLNSTVRWIWIGIVFVVAMVFYFVRMQREKYKTAEIMKAGKKRD